MEHRALGDVTFSGYVYEGFTNIPIEGAHIAINGIENYDVMTTANGSFTIVIHEGQYNITVSAERYNSYYDANLTFSADLMNDYQLQPIYYNVSGTVSRQGGTQTIASAWLVFERVGMGMYYNSSSDGGGFYIVQLPAWNYNVTISASEYSTATFYENFNSNTTRDFQLEWIAVFYQISGYIFEKDTSKMISGASVTFDGIDVMYHNITTTDSSGKYSIVVKEGNYNISISASGYEDMSSTNNYFSNDINGKNFELVKQGGSSGGNKMCHISGRVVDKDTRAGIAGAKAKFTPTFAGNSITITSTSSGAFSVDLKEGNYNVRIEASGYETITHNFDIHENSTNDVEMKSTGGNPFSNPFSANPFEDPTSIGSSPLIMGLSIFLCVGTPILLIVLTTVIGAIFTRLGSINERIEDISIRRKRR